MFYVASSPIKASHTMIIKNTQNFLTWNSALSRSAPVALEERDLNLIFLTKSSVKQLVLLKDSFRMFQNENVFSNSR